MLLQQLINGITLGTTYSLLALGYSLIFGVLSFINFAHGDVAVFGAYIAWHCLNRVGIGMIPSFVMAIAAAMLLGMGMEKVGYLPLRKAPRISAIIASLGFSFIVSTFIQIFWGTQSHSMNVFQNIKSYEFGNVIFSSVQLGVLFFSILIMILLTLFIKKTQIGISIRAVSLDRDTSSLMGVNVSKIISITFALGSALGAISAMMMVTIYGAIYPSMGGVIGTKGFAAVVLGGTGNIPGAMLGGILIGVIESLAGTVFNAQVKDAVAFIVLILVLLIKPSGILGKEAAKE